MNLTLDQTPLPRATPADFAEAQPFPLLLMDNFLPVPVADALELEIARQHDMERSNDYIFAKNKFEQPAIEAMGPAAAALHALLMSDGFAAELSRVYGQPLFLDPSFVGGGLHLGGERSFLDMHVDFARHPRQPRWIRELNILLYLNRGWKHPHGGQLDLRNSQTGLTRSIEPQWNRMVVMLTKGHTYHGYKAIDFPAGRFRTSIAAYAYSQAAADADLSGLRTTTVWAPEGGGLAKAAVARVAPALVGLKQRIFGSATARNAARKPPRPK